MPKQSLEIQVKKLKKAIKEKCKECSPEGNCGITDCSLYKFKK